MDKLQPLGCGIKIYVSSVHRFGTDAVLLADFAEPKLSDKACDLGTGCGIIPLLWCRHDAPESITAIDIQSSACRLAEASVKLNALDDRVKVLNLDLREPDRSLWDKFTLVTMNPPYKTVTGGLQSPDEERLIARHEVTCTVNDAAQCAARLLKFNGRLCMCHRPERLADLMSAMRENGIEPKRLRIVCQRADSDANLILLEGKKGAKPGMTVEAPLIIEDYDGSYSRRMREIHKDYIEAKEGQ